MAASEGLVSGYKLAEYDRFGAAVEEEKGLLMDDPVTSRPPHSLWAAERRQREREWW